MQGDDERTTISYPDGFGFFDLLSTTWYKPVNQSLPTPILISSLKLSTDNEVLYMTGNKENGNTTTGYVYSTKILLGNSTGQIASTNWKLLANTAPTHASFIHTVIPDSSNTFYIAGFFSLLAQENGTSVHANNIAYFDSGLVIPLEGGTDGEVVSGTMVTSTKPSILYIAGKFSSVFGVVQKSAKNIARWNGLGWADLDGGIELNLEYESAKGSPFLQIESWGSDVLVGGALLQAGSLPVNNVALWNGASWSQLPDDGQFEPYRMMPFSVAGSGKVFFAAQGLQNSIFEDIILDGL